MPRAESPKQVLTKLRALCLALPETRETLTWGHPNFRARDKIFAAFHEDSSGSPCIWLKVDPATKAVLQGDRRVSPSRHGATHWIGLRADLRLSWRMLRELVEESYRLVAPKRLVNALDGEP